MAELCNVVGDRSDLESLSGQRQWLAAYTRTQHENSVARQLQSKELSFLLPQYLKHNPRFLLAIGRQFAGART